MTLPIHTVTVLEDRAHVARRGVAQVSPSSPTISLEISPLVVDKTLFARVVRGGTRVNEIHVARSSRVGRDEQIEDVRRLTATAEEHERALGRIAAERSRCDTELNELDATARLLLTEVSGDVAHGKSEAERWTRELVAIAEREGVVRRAIVELDAQHAITKAKKSVADEHLATLSAVAPREIATVTLDLAVTVAEEVEVEIDYVVAGAAWRPCHSARALDDGAKVAFRSEACVWQATGEDWTDVALFFSTERPSLGTTPPALEPDVVVSMRRQTQSVVVAQREETIATAGLGGAKKITSEVPGIDDGGDPLRLAAKVKARIASDGRPHRVPLFEMESPAKSELVLIGEIAAAVLRKTTLENRAQAPILAGPVDLVRHSGLVGRTETLFVAPGERFAIGWGPDPALRVHRTHEEKATETKLLSSYRTTPHRVEIHISNLGPEPRSLLVQERIPVSELEKVKVAIDEEHTSKGARTDEDGFVRFELTLAPRSRETIELGYTVAKHSDIVGI